MQQQIQERNTSFSFLNRAEVLCSTWKHLQSKSLSSLQSISNLVSQRTATLNLKTLLEKHDIDQTCLVFKQSEAMNGSIHNLNTIVELFEKVKNDWSKLEEDASRHMLKASNIKQQLQKPKPLSTESMIQVTAVNPDEAYEMIASLGHMYKEEFMYKSVLLTTMQQYMSDHDQFQGLIDRWSSESRIDDQEIQNLTERVKLYKIVKKVLESVD